MITMMIAQQSHNRADIALKQLNRSTAYWHISLRSVDIIWSSNCEWLRRPYAI